MVRKIFCLTALAVAVLAACGGGGGGNAQTTTDTSVPPVVVTSNVVPNFTTVIDNVTGTKTVRVKLDASSSTSSSGQIRLYKVDWGDGQTTTSSTPNMVHDYQQNPLVQARTITLQVTDSTSTTKSVTKPAFIRFFANTWDGTVMFQMPEGAEIIGLSTEMEVPNMPDPKGIIAIWPGLEPAAWSPTYGTLGYGIIQPVLVWGGVGSSLTSYAPPKYSSWWVEGYVWNHVKGGYGGDIMTVAPGDRLKLSMTLNGTVWTQTVINTTNGKTVSYPTDMLGQVQGKAKFSIELKLDSVAGGLLPVSYINTKIQLAAPPAASNIPGGGSWCYPSSVGPNDVVDIDGLSADGKTCSVRNITLTPGPNTYRS